MDLHVKVLAAFHIILGLLGLMGSLMVLLLFGGAAGIISTAAPNDPDALLAVPIVGLIGGMIVMRCLPSRCPASSPVSAC